VYLNGGGGAPLISSPAILDTADPATLSHTFSGLTPGERYVFAVAAYSDVFESAKSNIIEIIAGTVPYKPDPITRSAASLTEIGISWSAPFNGDNAITAYIIESDGGSGGSFSQIGTSGAATISFLHTGLNNGQVYAYRVIASKRLAIVSLRTR